MKQLTLPLVTRGIDVRSAEGNLDKGSVRDALNVTLDNLGGVARRPEPSATIIAQAGAHSFWQNKARTRAFFAAGDTLYLCDPIAGTATGVFSGLEEGAPVSYDEGPGAVYFAAGDVLGRFNADGVVRRPGVAALLGHKPLLLPTTGGLYAGTYQVAYTLVNDLGEESAPSSVAQIELPSGGGITVTGLGTATDVVKMRIYVSPPGGSELYLYETRNMSSTATITDQHRGALLRFAGDIPMPGGHIVRFHKGRLLVASGSDALLSEPLNPGLHDPRAGWIHSRRRVRLLEVVDAGVFIGTADGVLFYRGDGPSEFSPVESHPGVPVEGTGCKVSPDAFDPRLVPDRSQPVAVWLSDVGLVVGRADGSIVGVQADRVSVETSGSASVSVIEPNGLRQVVFCVESMRLGANGAPDSTL